MLVPIQFGEQYKGQILPSHNSLYFKWEINIYLTYIAHTPSMCINISVDSVALLRQIKIYLKSVDKYPTMALYVPKQCLPLLHYSFQQCSVPLQEPFPAAAASCWSLFPVNSPLTEPFTNVCIYTLLCGYCLLSLRHVATYTIGCCQWCAVQMYPK